MKIEFKSNLYFTSADVNETKHITAYLIDVEVDFICRFNYTNETWKIEVVSESHTIPTGLLVGNLAKYLEERKTDEQHEPGE